MKIGVLIELFKDTDIEEKFQELRSMGMENRSKKTYGKNRCRNLIFGIGFFLHKFNISIVRI